MILPNEADLKAAPPYFEQAKTRSLYWTRGVRRISSDQRIFRVLFNASCGFCFGERNRSWICIRIFLALPEELPMKPANEALAEADLIVSWGAIFHLVVVSLIRKPILFKLTLTPRNLGVGTTQMSRC